MAKSRFQPTGAAQPPWRGRGNEIFFVEGETLMAAPVTTGLQLRAGEARRLFEHAGIARRPGRRYDVSAGGTRFVLIEPAGGPPRPFIGFVRNRFGAFPDRAKGDRGQ